MKVKLPNDPSGPTFAFGNAAVRSQVKGDKGNAKATAMGGAAGPKIDANSMALGKPVVVGHKSKLG